MTEGAGVQQDHEFELDVQRAGDVVVLAVAGDVDLYSAPELRDRLAGFAEEGGSRVVLDLTRATFLDSMALGVLLGAKRRLAVDGGELVLVVSTPEIRRIFEITMLNRIFELHEERESAIRSATQASSASASEE